MKKSALATILASSFAVDMDVNSIYQNTQPAFNIGTKKIGKLHKCGKSKKLKNINKSARKARAKTRKSK